MARRSGTDDDGTGGASAPLNPDSIPEELRERRQWVVWRHERRDGKSTKVPYVAKAPKDRGPAAGVQTAFRASATDPSTWRALEEALYVARESGFDGVGFVFSDSDPYAGVDLDACFDELGELHPDAARVVETLNSYSERSPSRTGLHIVLRADLNGHPRNRTDKVPWGGGIEIYNSGRYFTMTGNPLEDTPDSVEERQAELDEVLAELLPKSAGNGKQPPARTSLRSDSEVLARAFAAKNGPKLMALYRGDRTGYGSESQSDQALVSALAFWTGPDPGQLDRLFRGSGLMRPKWEREDYRDRTIAKALEGAEFFDWDDVPEPTRKLEELTELTVEKILDAADDDVTGELSELMKLLGKKESVATRIVALVKESDAVLFHDEEQIGYATIQVGGHVETHPVRSHGFKLWVRRLYWEKEESAPPGQSLTDALGVLEGEALFAGPTIPVHYRVAGDGKHSITIDMGDEHWRAIQITRDGWQVLDHHPLRFSRTGGMAALPEPERGGTLDRLRPFVNVDDGDWRLLIGWLLAALRPGSPYPVAVVHGEQGSAKSTAARVLRRLVDPNVVALRAAPHALDDLMVSSMRSWCVAYDNLSHLQPWLSDALCRLSTGGGLSKRQLYTDGDEVLLDAQRPVIINGIEELATRSDLLDRALLVECPLIPEGERKDEEEFWAVFDEHYPAIFGALLDALVGALANIGTVRLDRMPRMADFARWVTAAEPVLGWAPGTFMDAYAANRDESHELALEASIVGPPLLEVSGGGFEGTMTELLETLAGKVDEKVTRRKDWPKTGRGLSSHVKRLAPNLRALGVEVEFSREADTGRRLVRVARVS